MASPLRTYLGRSIDLLRRSTAKVVKMDATPQATPTTIFSFDSSLSSPEHPTDDVSHFGLGSDSEVGGLSTCNLALIPSSGSGAGSSNTGAAAAASLDGSVARSSHPDVSYSHMAFYGYMSTKVPPTQTGKIRTGYAGFRNTSRPTLFGQDTWDLELYTHLKVVVGYRGWEGWRNRWVVNIGIDGRPRSDVFQHRLDLPPSSASTTSKLPLDPLATSSPPLVFTTLYLPLSSFVLIKKGLIAASPIPLPRSDIRTVGFALLGRDRGDDGPLESTAASASGDGNGYTPGQGLKNLGMRLGGWGKTTAEEAKDDPELRALLEEDARGTPSSAGQGVEPGLARSAAPAPTPAPESALPSRPTRPATASGGYHRVGSGSTAGAGASTITALSTATAPNTSGLALGDEREGYYELCIKSVEAVKWDPENENENEPEV
ncbi:hypothetical protein I317_07241 [Kwoniella heveanensis CBS 569]|nr:hypothetical protein I317_07241 [Kwoniella heveanensis CBS 569]